MPTEAPFLSGWPYPRARRIPTDMDFDDFIAIERAKWEVWREKWESRMTEDERAVMEEVLEGYSMNRLLTLEILLFFAGTVVERYKGEQ